MQAGRKEAMQGGKQAGMQGGKQEGRHAGRQEGRQAGRQAGRKEESRQAGTKVYVRTSTATDPYFVPVLRVLVYCTPCAGYIVRYVQSRAEGARACGDWRHFYSTSTSIVREYRTSNRSATVRDCRARTYGRTDRRTDDTLITPEQTKFVIICF